MISRSLSRDLLALLCAVQAIATAAIDLGRAHARNPAWTGHARFHLVWQLSSTIALAACEIPLILMPGPYLSRRFYLAAMLAAVPMAGFVVAFLTRTLYGGAMSDPNGIAPARISIRGRQHAIDLNLVAEACAIVALAVLVASYRHAAGSQ